MSNLSSFFSSLFSSEPIYNDAEKASEPEKEEQEEAPAEEEEEEDPEDESFLVLKLKSF